MKTMKLTIKYSLSFISLMLMFYMLSGLNLVNGQNITYKQTAFYGLKNFSYLEEKHNNNEKDLNYRFWGVPEY